MWTGRDARGYTFIEVMITMAIIAMMALVIERTMASTQQADAYLTASRTAKERARKAAFTLHEAVSGARRLFQRDDVGRSYLESLEVGDLLPTTGVRLPLYEEARPLGPDVVGDPRTGNVLLFVQESDPVVCTLNVAAGVVRYMDVYYFVCAYPSRSTRRVVTREPGTAADLTLWYSKGYPSLPQILAIDDVDERASAVRDLVSLYGFEDAWDPTASAEDGFYALSAAGSVAALPHGHVIEQDPALTHRGFFVSANVQLAPTRGDSAIRKTVFTAPEAPAWVPNGFEVKIAGPSGRRKVWFHIVVETQAGQGSVAAQSATLIASVRDL